METDGGDSSAGKKRWTFEKWKETWKEKLHHASSKLEQPLFSRQVPTSTEDWNIYDVKTEDGDMGKQKMQFVSSRLEKLRPMSQLLMELTRREPAYQQTRRDIVGSQLSWDSSTLISNMRELQKQHGYDLNEDSSGIPVVENLSISDWNDSGMDEPSRASSDMNKLDIPEIKHDDMSAGEDMSSGDDVSSEEDRVRLTPEQIAELVRRYDDRNMDLLRPDLTWQQKVLEVLHFIRCSELTEYNPKQYLSVPTRFCEFNIAFFNLDKESEVEHGPLCRDFPESDYWRLDDSVNVISIKVAESDVHYPINIYGTVLARDRYDYRCVYLFKRGRDNPQLISSPDDTLTLTGPYRALAGTSRMFFEFHLKIKGDGAVDKDFSKGFLERDPCCDMREPWTLSLESYLSTVDMVYMPVPFAFEASIGVNILNGKFNFTGKINAWTTGTDESKIILYDSEVAGTETKLGSGGSVSLTRCVIAVPRDECLILDVSVCDGDHGIKCHNFVLGNKVEVCTCEVGPYELEARIIWKAVKKRCPKLWENIEDIFVLWEST